MLQLKRLRAARRRAIIRLGKNLRRHLDKILVRYSRVEDAVVFDERQFPFIAEIEAEWKVIRRELEVLLAHREHLPLLQEISPDHGKISTDEKWKVFFLHGYGERCERTRERCPETSQLLDRIPNLQNAFFSIMAPGKYAKRHRGVTKGFITWHLPLIVPEPKDGCVLKFDDRSCTWTEGRSLVFDDTNYHQVWNRTNRDRVVLLINFPRPMRWPGRLVAGAFLGAMKRTRYITDARENQSAWEDHFEAVAARSENPPAEPFATGMSAPIRSVRRQPPPPADVA